MPSPERPAPENGASEPSAAASTPSLIEHRPTVLGLARLSHRTTLAAGEEAVYRRIAQLTELAGGQEFLVVPSARGIPALFLAQTTGAAGSGVDPDKELVGFASAQAKEAGIPERLHYDTGPADDLPYKNDIFDLVIGDVGLAALPDPAAAVAELARVAKPMGSVVLIQPVWSRQIEAARREELVAHLGVRPYLLVEWKQMLRDAGVVELIVEDLTDAPNSWQTLLGAGLDIPSLRERADTMWRAWQTWGWRGLRRSFAAVHELRRLILRERILGLALIRGTVWRDDSR